MKQNIVLNERQSSDITLHYEKKDEEDKNGAREKKRDRHLHIKGVQFGQL